MVGERSDARGDRTCKQVSCGDPKWSDLVGFRSVLGVWGCVPRGDAQTFKLSAPDVVEGDKVSSFRAAATVCLIKILKNKIKNLRKRFGAPLDEPNLEPRTALFNMQRWQLHSSGMVGTRLIGFVV